ncbi:MAG: mannosyltransferase family protein [Phycisphaerae bacterium]
MSARATHLDRFGMLYALAVFGLTRVVTLAAAYAAPQDRTRADAPTWWSDLPTARWDGGHYRKILLDGYPDAIDDRVAFFPGYPLLARPLAGWVDADAALLVVTLLSGAGVVAVFYGWVRRHSDARTATWSVAILACWPATMFLSATYSEAVFLLCVAGALALLDRGRLFAAALLAGVATAVRPTGVILAALVAGWSFLALVGRPSWAVLWLGGASRRRDADRERGSAVADAPARGVAPPAGAAGATSAVGASIAGARLAGLVKWLAVCAVSVTGVVAFMSYLAQRYDRADAYSLAQAGWKTSPASRPWLYALTFRAALEPALRPVKALVRGKLGDLAQPRTWYAAWNLAFVAAGVVGLVRPGRFPRIVFTLPILVFLMAYIPDAANGGRLVSIERYQLAALPCFVLFAQLLLRVRGAAARGAGLVALLAMQCVYIQRFANWEFVG